MVQPWPETTVAPVDGRSGERAFLDVAGRLHRGNPAWVAPLRRAEYRRFQPRYNPSLEGRWVRRFVAWRDGVAVGRIAAILDPAFSAAWANGAGLFGFFDAADAPAARALLKTAEAALAAQGARCCLGPVNLTTHDEVGLLVEGFDRRPPILTPYHAPGSEAPLLAAGFAPCREYHSYLWTPDASPSAAVRRLVHRADGSVRLRSADDRHWDREVELLHEAYSSCFSDLWGFVPMSAREFAAKAREFRPFYRPELVLLAETAGRVVGFALVLPDVNEVLQGVGGRLWPFGWLRLWRGVGSIRSARFLLAGVHPEHRGRGIAARMAHAMDATARTLGLRSAELSLIQADNARMRHVVEAFGCRRIRTFRLYQKSLPAALQ